MANEIEKVDPDTGELMTVTEGNAPLAVQLAQAELNQAVTTARAFPRSITKAVQNIMSLATLDEESAMECVYALPRAGKPIKGASVRFAEIVASQWGNCHTASRVVDVDRFEKVIVAEGVFHDLETGLRRTAQIRRRISDKHGRIFTDDMIAVTGNAAASIAMREAILKGIPKAVWRAAYERCESVIAGNIKTLVVRRDDAIKAFAAWGVKPEQIFAALDVGGIDDVGLDELATLIAIHKAIKSEEQKVEDYFPAHSDGARATEAAKGTAAKLGKIADQGKAAKDEKKSAKKEGGDEQGATPKGEGKGKSKEGEKAADREEADQGDDQRQSEAEDEEGADDGGGAGGGSDAGITDAELEAAFKRGHAAHGKEMSRRAIPQELRDSKPLAEAWVRGWDEANNAE